MINPIKLDDIYFGERDALHEFLKQDRQKIVVLNNSFVIPPRVKMSELESGARYLILGPKGSGKTTLLWYLKRQASNSKSSFILFKSELRKEDRDKLDKMVDTIIVQDQRKFKVEADYKVVWEWYLIKSLISLIDDDDLVDGQIILSDIKRLLGIKTNRLNTIYDNFYINKIKGKVKLAVGLKELKSEISGEIEAKRSSEEIDLLDLIRLIQNFIGKIRLKKERSIRLYMDELEFFMSDEGDGERDRRLVRDLVFSINYINTTFSKANMDVAVIASLRTEILNSMSINSQEVGKIIDAFGVKLNWFYDEVENHRVLNIFQNKIQQSEVLSNGAYSEDVWSVYFPSHIGKQPIKSYLLDSGLHRPRGVLLRLMAALETTNEDYSFKEENFIKSEEIFGRYLLEEFSEEISAAYDEGEREDLLMLFRGHSFAFDRDELNQRIGTALMGRKGKKSHFKDANADNIIKFLYRIGMIGNQFYLNNEQGRDLSRNLWSFRGDIDPILDKRFVVHKAIRKVLQTQ
ncbi:P-loop ATPase, Sll1717 family [Methylobacterium sp. Leaf399]|uniref:P-loop ATPase, Sll1717 family n=1 Tax=Methylobacterium sp. Leaf399 TaxID=1736364 RepID=UPI000AE646F9|nr:ATP-binding cassette domain-containing protein [Methylobacterium sp. Leaf399]